MSVVGCAVTLTGLATSTGIDTSTGLVTLPGNPTSTGNPTPTGDPTHVDHQSDIIKVAIYTLLFMLPGQPIAHQKENESDSPLTSCSETTGRAGSELPTQSPCLPSEDSSGVDLEEVVVGLPRTMRMHASMMLLVD